MCTSQTFVNVVEFIVTLLNLLYVEREKGITPLQMAFSFEF